MPVPEDVVEAAQRIARARGQTVAELPLGDLARELGISRSTLTRRLGGRRAHLEDAVRAAGSDPGGRRLVRERGVEAAAAIAERAGLTGVTLEAVAREAECSVPALYATFGGKDGLLGAVFERYSPLLALDALAEKPPARPDLLVVQIHHAFVTAFGQSRILPAVFADLFARSDGPASRMFEGAFPSLFRIFERLFRPYIDSGEIRDLPVEVLAQLLLGPIVMHMLIHPAITASSVSSPHVSDPVALFSEAFLRAVAVDSTGTSQ